MNQKQSIITLFILGFLANPTLNITEANNCNIPAPASCFSNSGSNINTPGCSANGTQIVLNTAQADYINQDSSLSLTVSSGTSTSVRTLQSFLKTHPYVKNLVEQGSNCPVALFDDGQYGVCTKAVFEEYLKKSCDNELIDISVVVQDENNEPLFATLQSTLSPKKAAVSDSTGKAVLENISKNDTIVFSHVGKEEFSIVASDITTNMTVTMIGDELGEIVVTGKKIEKESASTTAVNSNIKESDSNDEKLGWNENMLRPKFQTGANWQSRKYTGDASDITYWLQKFGGKITGLLSAIAVLIIAYNGFLITTAGSDEDSLGTAKTAIKWALLGLVGLNFVYLIVKTVISIPF